MSNEINYDFHQFVDLMKQTTENLKKMREAMDAMRWQFGGSDLDEFADLRLEIEASTDGWISSAC